MVTRRFVPLALAGLATGTTQAQTPHWLLGTWGGEIIGLVGALQTNRRMLIVTDVQANGTVAARFGGEDIVAQLRNGELTFRASHNNPESLRQTGPDTLEGYFIGNQQGRRFSLVMQRRPG